VGSVFGRQRAVVVAVLIGEHQRDFAPGRDRLNAVNRTDQTHKR